MKKMCGKKLVKYSSHLRIFGLEKVIAFSKVNKQILCDNENGPP